MNNASFLRWWSSTPVYRPAESSIKDSIFTRSITLPEEIIRCEFIKKKNEQNDYRTIAKKLSEFFDCILDTAIDSKTKEILSAKKTSQTRMTIALIPLPDQSAAVEKNEIIFEPYINFVAAKLANDWSKEL